jgi:hypothetical protein
VYRFASVPAAGHNAPPHLVEQLILPGDLGRPLVRLGLIRLPGW